MIILFFLIVALIYVFIRYGNGGENARPRELIYTTPAGGTWSLYEDMLKQPHILIAGATGSGKSVAINGLISTILFRLPFDQNSSAQMILIDPKRVELSAYKNLPHVLRYASEPVSMISALQYAQSIADQRYQKMQSEGKRLYSGSDVYIVIDEFADLMTTQKKTVVPIVQRLAQTGRAARVHLIIATQTPIAEVLPTKIKCNFDARLGLHTRSAQDSRNIIGKNGLEALPRYGKGYYMTPEKEVYYNIPYVPEEELDRLIAWWESQDGTGKQPAAA